MALLKTKKQEEWREGGRDGGIEGRIGTAAALGVLWKIIQVSARRPSCLALSIC